MKADGMTKTERRELIAEHLARGVVRCQEQQEASSENSEERERTNLASQSERSPNVARGLEGEAGSETSRQGGGTPSRL